MKKLVGIIGHPIEHSISPAMHNAAFKKLGLEFEYVPFDVKPEDLSEAINGFRALHVAGFNVTVPHKENVMQYLNRTTKLAETIGAVNTVKNQDGELIGYNTDGPGFIESLMQDAGFDPKGKNVLVIGAGGASRAVALSLAEGHAKTIYISDVAAGKADALAKYIDSFENVSCKAIELSQGIFDQIDLLVNATPIGMHPMIDASPIPEGIKLPKELMVYDLVYTPSETKILKAAKKAGCKTCTGLGMLVRQGALAFTLFTGEEAPIETMQQSAKAALRL
ncbi:MAG: shikimate dehydrogenase [Candidatus Margulisiibacteriota bacterium]